MGPLENRADLRQACGEHCGNRASGRNVDVVAADYYRFVALNCSDLINMDAIGRDQQVTLQRGE
jgi:hypothetical protein